MYLVLVILVELIILWLLSRHLTKIIYTIFYLVFGNKRFAITILTFLYLAGTVIHELAHLIVAEILRVPTGEISFTPVVTKRENNETEIRLAHVEIGSTDPFRRYIIGFAPIISGLFFLCLVIWLYQYFSPQFTDFKLQLTFMIFLGYLIFTISNNMFSSQKDLEGFIFFLPVLIIIFASLYIAGIRLNLTGASLAFTVNLMQKLAQALGIVLVVNLAILFLNGVMLRSIFSLRRKF